MRKKVILGVLALALVLGTTTYWVIKKKKAQNSGQPQQSAEEILQERARQANTHITTPLGKSFVAKNWSEFNKGYNPKKDFNELGQIIRACYIDNCFKDFKKVDLDEVFSLVVKTFSEMRSQDFALAGLLITQFERLATPAHDSENYRALEAWYKDPDASPAKKRMAILKLAVQDAQPSPQWVQVISQGITGKTFGLNRATWIQMVGDMRNLEQRKVVLNIMLKDFNKIDSDAQSDALVVLAQSSVISPKKVKDIFFKFLASNDQREFEAALRSVLPQNDEHAFNEHEIQKIKDRLHSIPEKLDTPYVNLKAKELLNDLK